MLWHCTSKTSLNEANLKVLRNFAAWLTFIWKTICFEEIKPILEVVRLLVLSESSPRRETLTSDLLKTNRRSNKALALSGATPENALPWIVAPGLLTILKLINLAKEEAKAKLRIKIAKVAQEVDKAPEVRLLEATPQLVAALEAKIIV